MNILKIIKERQSSREFFDPKHSISKKDLNQILEAAIWSPTPHNMQNFFIIVIYNKETLEKIGNIKFKVSETFLKENYQQFSFSEEELLKKRVGIMATGFPKSWRTPEDIEKYVKEDMVFPLSNTIKDSPTILIVLNDTRKRAPASEEDMLGKIGIGAVMENMWIVSTALGIGFQIMSMFSFDSIKPEIKKILEIPEFMDIAFTARLGYPVKKDSKYLRIRKHVEDFAYDNKFGNKYTI